MSDYPKYVLRDGYIGCYSHTDPGNIPIYRFPGGCSAVDDFEIEQARKDNWTRESLIELLNSGIPM